MFFELKHGIFVLKHGKENIIKLKLKVQGILPQNIIQTFLGHEYILHLLTIFVAYLAIRWLHCFIGFKYVFKISLYDSIGFSKS